MDGGPGETTAFLIDALCFMGPMQVSCPALLAVLCVIVCLALWCTVPFPLLCSFVPVSARAGVAAGGYHFELTIIIIL